MRCAICRRDARGFGFAPALVRMDGPLRKLCSMRCMHITARLKGMIDPNKHEVNALAAASSSVGRMSFTWAYCFTFSVPAGMRAGQ